MTRKSFPAEEYLALRTFARSPSVRETLHAIERRPARRKGKPTKPPTKRELQELARMLPLMFGLILGTTPFASARRAPIVLATPKRAPVKKAKRARRATR